MQLSNSKFILLVLFTSVLLLGAQCTPSTNPQCNDGVDNDNDNLVDYPNDPGCSFNNDDTEVGDDVGCCQVLEDLNDPTSDSSCSDNTPLGVCQQNTNYNFYPDNTCEEVQCQVNPTTSTTIPTPTTTIPVPSTTLPQGPGSIIWDKTFDFGTNDEANGVAVDSNDDVYIVGRQNTGESWGIIKLDSNGNELWDRSDDFSPVGDDVAKRVAVDSNDDVYVVGEQGTSTWRVMKINGNSAATIWEKVYGLFGGASRVNDIALDSANNVYVVGAKGVSLTDWHIMSFDSNGFSLWNKTIDHGANDKANGVAVDSNDDVYVVGNLGNIMKFDQSGNMQWNVTYTGFSENDIAIDSLNNLYVVGSQVNVGENNWRIMKVNSNNGVHIWNKVYDPGGQEEIQGVTVDSNDDIYIVGREAQADNDWRVMKLDNNGNTIFTKTFNLSPNILSDVAKDVAVDSNDDVYVVGFIQPSLTDWHIMKLSN